MSYREKYQYILTFLADAVALIVSVLLSYLIFGIWLQVIPQTYTDKDYLQFYLILALTFLIGFIGFDQEQDITSRRFRGDLLRSAEMTLIIGAASAFLMIVAKISLADSRYFFFGILAFNFLLQPLVLAVIKLYLRYSDQKVTAPSWSVC